LFERSLQFVSLLNGDFKYICFDTVFATAFGTNAHCRTIYTALNHWLTMPVFLSNHLYCKRNIAQRIIPRKKKIRKH